MRYVPFSQQPYCCAPTSLQMVLYRRGLPLLSQEEIGFNLGLTVPTSDAALLPLARSSATPPTPAGFGTQVQNEDFSLNRFFEKLNYPLQYEYFAPDDLDSMDDVEIENWVNEQISQDFDVLICFNYFTLYGNGDDQGHVCVVEAVEDGTVLLVEPNPSEPKFREVPLDQLLVAMRHNGRSDHSGFWVIQPVAQAA